MSNSIILLIFKTVLKSHNNSIDFNRNEDNCAKNDSR